MQIIIVTIRIFIFCFRSRSYLGLGSNRISSQTIFAQTVIIQATQLGGYLRSKAIFGTKALCTVPTYKLPPAFGAMYYSFCKIHRLLPFFLVLTLQGNLTSEAVEAVVIVVALHSVFHLDGVNDIVLHPLSEFVEELYSLPRPSKRTERRKDTVFQPAVFDAFDHLLHTWVYRSVVCGRADDEAFVSENVGDYLRHIAF